MWCPLKTNKLTEGVEGAGENMQKSLPVAVGSFLSCPGDLERQKSMSTHQGRL